MQGWDGTEAKAAHTSEATARESLRNQYDVPTVLSKMIHPLQLNTMCICDFEGREDKKSQAVKHRTNPIGTHYLNVRQWSVLMVCSEWSFSRPPGACSENLEEALGTDLLSSARHCLHTVSPDREEQTSRNVNEHGIQRRDPPHLVSPGSPNWDGLGFSRGRHPQEIMGHSSLASLTGWSSISVSNTFILSCKKVQGTLPVSLKISPTSLIRWKHWWTEKSTHAPGYEYVIIIQLFMAWTMMMMMMIMMMTIMMMIGMQHLLNI